MVIERSEVRSSAAMGLSKMKWSRYLLSVISAISPGYFAEPGVRAQDRSTNQATIQVSQSKKTRPTNDDPSNAVPGSVPLQPELRIKAIGQRIDIIKEIMAQKQAQAAMANAKAIAKAPEPDPALPSVKNSSPEIKHLADEKAQPSSPKSKPTETKAEETSKLANDSEKKELAEFPINTSPMNSMELANSLFITGHYDQARKGYEALLAKEKTGLDREWLRCLAANCYRVQGDFSTAEKLYRQVVSAKKKSYPSDQSKWYLDHLTRRKKIKTELELLDAELQPFQQQPTAAEESEQNQSQKTEQGDE